MQGLQLANTPASCSKQAARATPKGSAHCKGPQDRLLTARYACFVPMVAINKPDFLAGYSLFYESARYRGDFLAVIENNRNFTLSRVRSPQTKKGSAEAEPFSIVEMGGLEPPSKHRTRELSTRLVLLWFSTRGCRKTGHQWLIL